MSEPSLLSTSNNTDALRSSTPPTPGGIDIIDLVGSPMRYLLIPLVPFFISATIRLLDSGWSLNVLDPAQLAFSFATLCMLVNVSAQRLKDSTYREAVTALFTFGMFVFVALFTYADSAENTLIREPKRVGAT